MIYEITNLLFIDTAAAVKNIIYYKGTDGKGLIYDLR
ncbi:hypothetical protein JOC76_005815 [Neobacillus cucumis]|nr:hypothetical protein [Neobacillus cucumis]